ncbi:MAG: hypothetical protein JRE40_03145 [Deltaproteobacteria bacterium]|nr:hypothetical protein [Deltaproteobacteria bacterium]
MTTVVVPVRPSDPPFKIPLAAATSSNQAGDDANPRNWVWKWRDDNRCAGMLRDQFHRVDAQGNLAQRFIIEAEMRTPNAIDASAVTSGMDWEAMDPFRKHVLIDILEERRAEDLAAGRPLTTIEFYVGSISDGMPGLIRNHTSSGVPTLNNDKGIDNFRRKWEPWIEAEVLSGIWWDAGVKIDNKGTPLERDRFPLVIDLIEDAYQRYGLHGGTEMIRWNSYSGFWPKQVYDWAPYQIPMLAISRSILDRDHDQSMVFDPGNEVWIMNSDHKRWDGSPGALTVEQARDYERRNVRVGSWIGYPHLDDKVNLPPVGTPEIG